MLARRSFQAQLQRLRQSDNPNRAKLIEALHSLDQTQRRALREKTDITGRSLGESLVGILRNGFDAEFVRPRELGGEYVIDRAFSKRFSFGGGNDYVTFDMDGTDRIVLDNANTYSIVEGNGVRNGSMIFKTTATGSDLVAVIGHDVGTSLSLTSLAGGGAEILVI